MIELNERSGQDFLNRKWVNRLKNAGVDMSDSKYFIARNITDGKDYIDTIDRFVLEHELYDFDEATYTLSELVHKLKKILSSYVIADAIVSESPITSLASLLEKYYLWKNDR